MTPESRRRGGRRPRASDSAPAKLVIEVRLEAPSSPRSVSRITRLAFIDRKGEPHPLPPPLRLLYAEVPGEAPWTEELPVEPGRFEAVALSLTWMNPVERGQDSLETACTLDLLSGVTTLLELVIELAPKARRPSLAARARSIGLEAAGRVEAGRLFSLALDAGGPALAPAAGPSLEVAAGALPPGTEVRMRRIRGGEPALQRPLLSAAVEIQSSSPLQGEALLTLPVDAQLARLRHVPAERLVVARRDGETVRELAPLRVGAERSTVTVRTTDFSGFGVVDSSVNLIEPPLVQNAVGEVLAYADGDTLTIYGTTRDPDATVAVEQAVSGWSRLGWFFFTGVPVADFDTLVLLRVTAADGSVTRSEVRVRRALPRKRVDAVHRFYGPSVAFGEVPPRTSQSTPFASAVTVQSSRFGDEHIFPNLAKLQRAPVRNGVRLYTYDAGADSWSRAPLVPESFFENEAARWTIRQMARIGLDVPVDAGIDPFLRFLAAADELLNPQAEPTLAQDIFRVLFPLGYARFNHRTRALSGTIPLTAWPDRLDPKGPARVGAAWVAATLDGIDAASGSGMRELYTLLYEPPYSAPPDVKAAAGKLFFRACRADGLFTEPELVDPDWSFWCGTIALRNSRGGRRPAVLALGVQPDGDAGGPASAVRIYQRGDDGAWQGETVIDGAPVLDADFAIDPSTDEPWLVVTIADQDPALLPRNGHLRVLRRTRPLGEAGRWEAAPPVSWTNPEGYGSSDLGMWPRIESDGTGRKFLAFVWDSLGGGAPIDPNTIGDAPPVPPTLDQAVVWFVGALEETAGAAGRWRFARAGSISYFGNDAEIDGVAHPRLDPDFYLGLTPTSRVGFPHFAPSICVDFLAPGKPTDALWYAYGAGVLHLARVDVGDAPKPLVVNSVCDVDRTTGLYAAVTTRDFGAPVAVYKDPFGSGMFGRIENDPAWNCGGGPCNPDELQFFALDQGTRVPTPSPEPPLAPGRFRGAIDMIPVSPGTAAPATPEGLPLFDTDVGFGAREMLTCKALRSWKDRALGERTRASLNPLLASMLMNCSFDFTVMRGHNDQPLPLPLNLGTRRREGALAGRLARLRQSRPDITSLAIVNDSAAEDIDRIVVTIFGEIFNADDGDKQMRTALNMGQVPAKLSMLFSDSGLQLAPGPAVTAVDSTHWQISDFWPELALDAVNSVSYLVTLAGDKLSAAPSNLVTGFSRNVPGAEPDCSLRDVVDAFAPFMAPIFANVVPDFPEEFKKRSRLIMGTGMKVTAAPFDWTTAIQQGGVEFTVDIPQFQASGDDPATFLVRQTSPSKLHFELAPMVQENVPSWYVRDVNTELGQFDVDVDAPWWARGIVAAIVGVVFAPFGAFLLAIAEGGGRVALDAALTEIGRRVVSSLLSRTEVPVPPGLSGLVTAVVADFVVTKFRKGTPPLDAVYLRGGYLQYWAQSQRVGQAGLPAAAPTVLPPELHFEASVNGPPARRNLLVTNDQPVPILLESVAPRVAGGEYGIASPPAAPTVLVPGASVLVEVVFTPQPPPGLHSSSLEILFNGGNAVQVPLIGLARQEGQLVVIPPDTVRFGIVDVGAASALRVELRNVGGGPLHVTAFREEGAATFTVAQAAPLTVDAGASSFVDVTYRPQQMLSGGDRGTLVIESDDAANPVVRLGLFGVGVTAGMVVIPTAWQFPDTRVGDPAVRRPLAIYSTGVVPLRLTAASFRVVDRGGGAVPDFRVLDAHGAPFPARDTTIQSGGSLNLLVEFAPVAVGARAGSLNLTAMNPNVPAMGVALTGRGV